MFKGLLLSCLLSTSVSNTTPPLAPVLEPSRALSTTSFSEGDIYQLSYDVYASNYYVGGSLIYGFDIRLLSITLPPEIMITVDNALSLPVEIGYLEFCTHLMPDSTSFLYYEDLDIANGTDYRVNPDDAPFEVSLVFECLTDGSFESFALPYLTKIESPYVPPAKSNLYRLLYDFYYSLFSDEDLSAISTSYNMPFDNWLAHTCTIATLILLIVVAFFFLRWLFKTVSGLILLRH